MCTAFVGQTYCVTVKDEREARSLQTVSLSNMPSTTSNSSVIQYTPISAECQYFIPGMHCSLHAFIFLASMPQCAVFFQLCKCHKGNKDAVSIACDVGVEMVPISRSWMLRTGRLTMPLL